MDNQSVLQNEKVTSLFKANLNYFDSSDDGRVGKAYEVTIRNLIQPKSRRIGVTRQFAWYGDMRKHNYNYEIKTGCCELVKLENDEIDLWKIFPKMDFIIYCPEVDENVNILQQGYVFTREDFIDMLISYAGKGKIIRTKTGTHGGIKITLQSFFSENRQKSSRKIRKYIDNCCECQPDIYSHFIELASYNNVVDYLEN